MDAEDLDYLTSRLQSRLERAWRAMVRSIQDDNSLGELADKIAAGDLDGLLSGVQDAAETFALDINGGFVTAGQKTARWLDGEVDGTVRFDIASDNAIDWMTAHGDDFVRGMINDQQQTIERVVTYGRARGLSDSDIAAEVRDSVGLNVRQVDAIETYRTALTTGDYRNALDRQLSDGRYDRALERAAEQGTTIAPARVEPMVSAYRRNWVDSRGASVATFESQAATHAGVDELLDQAVSSENITGGDVARTWNTLHDGKVRSSHRAMEGQVRAVGQPFDSGLGGSLMYPCDPSASVEDTAGCRCFLTLSVSQTAKRATHSPFRVVDDSLPA